MSVLDREQQAEWSEQGYESDYDQFSDREFREGFGFTLSWERMIHKLKIAGTSVVMDYVGQDELVGENVVDRLGDGAKLIEILPGEGIGPLFGGRFKSLSDEKEVEKAGSVAIVTGSNNYDDLARIVTSARYSTPRLPNMGSNTASHWEYAAHPEPLWHDLSSTATPIEFEFENSHGVRKAGLFIREIIVPKHLIEAEVEYLRDHPFDPVAVLEEYRKLL